MVGRSFGFTIFGQLHLLYEYSRNFGFLSRFSCLLGARWPYRCAAQEERFTRKKHDANFPVEATKYCLELAGLSIGELDAIVFYDKPFLKFERLWKPIYHSLQRVFARLSPLCPCG